MRKVDELFAEALELPSAERAELAHRLAESLESSPAPNVEQMWVREIARRIERLRDGTVRTVPSEEALASARAKLAANRG